jgi:hypothetical protein
MEPSEKVVTDFHIWPFCADLEAIHDSLFVNKPFPACYIIKNHLAKSITGVAPVELNDPRNSKNPNRGYYKTYSVPVLAYLQYANQKYLVVEGGELSVDYTYTEGLSTSFEHSISVGMSLGTNISAVDIAGNLVSTDKATQAWQESKTLKTSAKLTEPGWYKVYQVGILHAHFIEQAEKCLDFVANSKIYKKNGKSGLLVLTSVQDPVAIIRKEVENTDLVYWDLLKTMYFNETLNPIFDFDNALEYAPMP